MNNSFLTRFLSICLAFALMACGSSAPADSSAEVDATCPPPATKVELTSEEVNLFTWAEYVPQEIIDCFEEVYNVKLNHDLFSSPEEMYAKLGQGAATYDVVQPPDYLVPLMARQGMLAQLDHSRLPVLQHFAPQYLDPPFDPGNQYSLPYQLGSSGIAYHADKVKPPTAYADLWQPEYADRLILLDDARNIIGMTLLTLGYDPNTSDPTQLAAAKAKLLELTPNVRFFDSDSPKTALIAGDADLGVMWSGEASLAQAETPAVAYLYPAEGVLLFQDNFAITAEAPHLDAAYAWLNYLYQPDVFWRVMRDYPYANPNAASLDWAKTHQPDLYAAYTGSTITNIPAAEVEKGHWLHDLGEAAPLYDQIWTESKGQ